nr:putative defensin-like protein 120 [Nicotiana tomentosiformis]
MAKLLTCVFLVAALFLVGTIIPSIKAANTCYQIHTEILCDQGKVEPKCLPFCKQKFGPQAGGQCIENVGIEGPFCACNYPC